MQVLFDEFCRWVSLNQVTVGGEVRESFTLAKVREMQSLSQTKTQNLEKMILMTTRSITC
jgi:hypothetical protein